MKAWVLRQARGRCERCRCAAPFKRTDGTPYLELHHATQLAEGGPDTVDNAVALCANCHRLLHHSLDIAVFSSGPRAHLDDPEPHAPCVPPGPGSGLAAVIGQWPGDETDEQVLAALAELS